MSLDSRADELDKKLEDNPIDKSIEVLVRASKRQHIEIRLLAVTMALGFVLTIGVAILAFKTNEALKLAQNNQEAVLLNCETANESRKNQRSLWGYILEIPPNSPPTAPQEDRNNKFRDFVNTTFAERDCKSEAARSAE